MPELVTRPFSGTGDDTLPDPVKELPAAAKKIWVAAFNSAWEAYDPEESDQPNQEAHAFAVAWGAVNAKFKKADGEWVERVYLQGGYDAPFSSVKRAGDVVTWRATISDDGVDKYATRMTTDLFDDFITNAEARGMPFLTIAHFNQLARIGRATNLYRDGRRLKAEGVFFTDDATAERCGAELDDLTRQLAVAAAATALADVSAPPRERSVRTSIGFKPGLGAVEMEDLGVISYTRGWLPEITMTTHPGNSRADFTGDERRSGEMTTRITPEFMEQDAATIVGDELAKKLRDRLEAVNPETRSDADVLDLIFRSLEDAIDRAAVPGHKGRTKETSAWDGKAATKRAREHAGGPDAADIDWTQYRGYFAVYDAENKETLGAYGFIHHDTDDKGRFVDLAGVLAAGSAARGGRSGKENKDAQKHLGGHYRQFDRTPPWERKSDRMLDRLEDVADAEILELADHIDGDAVERVLALLSQGLADGKITDTAGVEIEPSPNHPGDRILFRSKWGEVNVPMVQRAGRRIQGKRLDQLNAAAGQMAEASKSIASIVEWARGDDGGDDGERSYEPQEIEPDGKILDRLRLHDGMVDADDSIVETMEYSQRIEVLMRATFTLSDIIAANFAPDDEEHGTMSLDDRMANVNSALNEYATIVNSLLVSAFGGGRSGPADNSDEVKNRTNADGSARVDVKPKGKAVGAVKPGDGSPEQPDLQVFDAAAKTLRQLVLDDAPAEELQQAVVDQAHAIEEARPQPDPEDETEVSPADDAVLQRVAGVEMGLSEVQAGIVELLNRGDAPPAETPRPPAVPRRRSRTPGPGPATPPETASAPTEPVTSQGGPKRHKISDVVRDSFGSPARYP